MGLKAFQTDLQNGMSIQDALMKHNLTLETAFQQLHKQAKTRKHPPKTYTYNASQYIQYRGGHYYLRKTVFSKKKGRRVTRMFGTYQTLEDAIKMREAQKEIGWKVTHVDRLCKELGITRCTYWNNRVRYH